MRFIIIAIFFLGTCLANEREIKCTDNVLEQIYQNQNACVLEESIPRNLQGLPFAIYPTQVQTYNTERFNFNKRFNVFPKAIFIPGSQKALAKALKKLRNNNQSFSVRSGGHCFEPGSLSSNFILDLRRFDTIKLTAHDEVSVGAGVRLGPLIQALGSIDRAIPTGTCQSVGVSGLTLGGGIGFLARTYGLTADVVKKITLLTANSEIIEVDEGHFPDLFWALRGAGNNSYGIALRYTFKTFYVPKASYFELKWEWNAVLALEIFHAWHTWIQNLPESINPVFSIGYSEGKLSLMIMGLKVGNEPFTEWQQAFGSLNPSVEIKTGRYVDLAEFWADSPKTPFAKVKSLMAFNPISDQAFAMATTYLQSLQYTQAPFQVNFQFVALGGKYAEGDTAFFPRSAVEWWHQVANWKEQEQEPIALKSLRTFYANVQPLVSNYCYSNDTDYDLGSTYLNAYYGDHVDRLKMIKRKYDPKNIFHWTQSIPLY